MFETTSSAWVLHPDVLAVWHLTVGTQYMPVDALEATARHKDGDCLKSALAPSGLQVLPNHAYCGLASLLSLKIVIACAREPWSSWRAYLHWHACRRLGWFIASPAYHCQLAHGVEDCVRGVTCVVLVHMDDPSAVRTLPHNEGSGNLECTC